MNVLHAEEITRFSFNQPGLPMALHVHFTEAEQPVTLICLQYTFLKCACHLAHYQDTPESPFPSIPGCQ